jgi:hypothetical protein
MMMSLQRWLGVLIAGQPFYADEITALRMALDTFSDWWPGLHRPRLG